MKEKAGVGIIALIIFLLFAIPTFCLAVRGQISTGLTATLLTFSVVVGLLIVTYPFLKRLRFFGAELETFEREVGNVKEEALAEVRKEITTQKQTLEDVREDIVKISSLVFKAAFVLAEGSRRYGGVPEEHEAKLREYLEGSAIIRDQKEKILQEVRETLRKLNDAIEERNKS